LSTLAEKILENGSVNQLYEKFASELFSELKQTSKEWLRSSRDRFLFETFIMQAGSSNRHFLNEIIDILQVVMHPDRDPEVRNQCLILVANLLQFIDGFETNLSVDVLINECILPNMQWKAGRTAAALRATAIATLWALFQSKTFHFQQVTYFKSFPISRVVHLILV